MFRAVLVGMLALAVPACSKASEPAAKSQPGAPAGRVTEVAGKVTAERDGKVRPLSVGDSVSGDDTIETAADASVKVELAHNHVELALGPSTKKRVDESVAWSAPTKTTVAKAGEGDTAAAGRPMERSAADGVATAPGAAAAPAPAAAPMAPPEVEEKKDEKEAMPPPAAQPALERADAPSGGGSVATKGAPARGGGGIGAMNAAPDFKKAAPPPPPPPPPVTGAASADATTALPPPKIVARAAVAPRGPIDIALEEHRTELEACLTTSTMDHAEFGINVDARGKGTVVLVTKLRVPPTVDKCVSRVVAKIKFPKQKASTRLVITKGS